MKILPKSHNLFAFFIYHSSVYVCDKLWWSFWRVKRNACKNRQKRRKLQGQKISQRFQVSQKLQDQFFNTFLVIKNIFYRPRIKYLTHVANLQFYLSKGLVLRKIHTLIKFKQEDFASKFIKMTTKLRKNALTNFDKAFWKFVNNVLFGKSMEGKSAKFLA